MKADTKPTAEIIQEMGRQLRASADELDHVADKLVKSGEWDYASEAMCVIRNLNGNLRLDLLVSRPLRAHGHR